MKKIILIFAVCVAIFTSCKKEPVTDDNTIYGAGYALQQNEPMVLLV